MQGPGANPSHRCRPDVATNARLEGTHCNVAHLVRPLSGIAQSCMRGAVCGPVRVARGARLREHVCARVRAYGRECDRPHESARAPQKTAESRARRHTATTPTHEVSLHDPLRSFYTLQLECETFGVGRALCGDTRNNCVTSAACASLRMIQFTQRTLGRLLHFRPLWAREELAVCCASPVHRSLRKTT